MSWTNCLSPTKSNIFVDGKDPANFQYWAYVKKTPKSPEDAVMCDKNQGDPYLGMISNECECTSDPPDYPKYNGIKYLKVNKDCQVLGPGSDINTCIGVYQDVPCNFPKCEANGNDYGYCGVCGFLNNKAHFWWQRDWNSELNTDDKVMDCCLTPTEQQDRTKKCPNNVWYGNPTCFELSKKYCTPDMWDDKCDTFMNNNYKNADGNINYSNSLFTFQMENYISDLKNNKPDPNDPFVDTILKWCSDQKLKGICSNYTNNICKNITKDDIQNDKTGKLGKLCACHLSSEEYLLPGIIPPECDSLCQLATTDGGIPIYYFNRNGDLEQKTCSQNTCVMDNVTISYINSQNQGETDFNQFCGCPTSGSCTCIMNNIDINSINSKIKGGTTLSQKCGACSLQNKDGTNSYVDCGTGLPLTNPNVVPEPPQPNIHDNSGNDKNRRKKIELIFMISIVFLIIIIVLAIYLLR